MQNTDAEKKFFHPLAGDAPVASQRVEAVTPMGGTDHRVSVPPYLAHRLVTMAESAVGATQDKLFAAQRERDDAARQLGNLQGHVDHLKDKLNHERGALSQLQATMGVPPTPGLF